eukprot:Seg5689.1 transcript_id=Seg5689.1/GoldUCD/mRNA.D3Y31 product="Fanconi anemia group A protein" protein_id=Seg5689.1/GoldUCD/D3Y31
MLQVQVQLSFYVIAQNPVMQLSKVVKTLPALPLLSEWIDHSESSLRLAPTNSGKPALSDIQGLEKSVADCRYELLFDICSSTVTAEYLALQLSSLIPKPGEHFDIDAIVKVIDIVRNLDYHEKIKRSDVATSLIKRIQLIPLAILIRLLEAKLLCLEDYFKRLQAIGSLEDYLLDEIIGHFTDSCKLSCTETHCDWSVNDDKVLIFLVSLISVGSTEDNATVILQQKLNDAIYKIFSRHDFRNLHRNAKQTRCLLIRLTELDEISPEKKKILAALLVRRFICLREQPNMDDSYNKPLVEDAYNNHTEWLFGKLSQNSVNVIQSLLLNLDDDTIADVLCHVLRGTDCNYHALLSITSVWLYSSEASISLMTNTLEKIIRESVEIRSTSLMKNAFLLARHCSLEGQSGFPSYADLLKGLMNKLEILLVEDREALATYIKCLSMVLPIENRDFLKTHLNTLPQVTSTAKNLINEYVVVAKTRLNDLKDSANLKGSSVTLPDNWNDFAQKDVERNLHHYASNSVLPKSLLEMSVFRKSYFVGQFLPTLLNPEAVRGDEIRRRFVEDLKNDGKIPNKLYHAFQLALETESLTDMFTNPDSDFQGFIERIIAKVAELPQAVSTASGIKEPKKRRLVVQSYVSSLSSYLSKIGEARKRYDINSIEQALFESKIIDSILDNICHGCAVSLGADDCKWMKSLMRMLSQHQELFGSLKSHIIQLLTSNLNALEEYHLQPLACIIAAYEGISMSNDSIIKGVITTIFDTKTASPINIQQNLLFVSYMLLYCSVLHSDVIVIEDELIRDVAVVVDTVLVPHSVVKLWEMMLYRLRIVNSLLRQSCEFATEKQVSSLSRVIAIAEALKDQRAFSAVTNNDQLDLNEWVNFELRINSQEDVLPHLMKQEYYLKVINDQQKVEHSSQFWSCENVATTIVHSMLSYSNIDKAPIGGTCKAHKSGSVTMKASVTSWAYLSQNGAEDRSTSDTMNKDNGTLSGANRASLSTNIFQDRSSTTKIVNGVRVVINKPTTERHDISPNTLFQDTTERIATNKGYVSTNRQTDLERLPQGGNSDLLRLLRSLNEEIVSKCEEVDDDLFAENSSWLLNAFKTWIRKQNEVEKKTDKNMEIFNINPHQLTHIICAIMDSLPKSLLFANNASSQPSYDSLENVSVFVNQLSGHVIDNSFYLPCSLTIRLLDALASYCLKPNALLQDEAASEANSNIHHFLSSSIIFHVSLVQHHVNSSISRRIQTLIDNGLGSLQNIVSMHNALQSLSCEVLTRLDSSNEILGVCIFNSWWNQSSASKADLLAEMVVVGEAVIRVFFECFILKLSTYLWQGDALSNAATTRELSLQAVRVIKMIPNAVISLVGEIFEGASYSGLRNLRYNLIGKFTLKLAPIVVVKILAAMDPLYLKRFSSLANCSEVIANGLRRSEDLLIEARADWPKEVMFSPLDVSFVKELGIVRNILQF